MSSVKTAINGEETTEPVAIEEKDEITLNETNQHMVFKVNPLIPLTLLPPPPPIPTKPVEHKVYKINPRK